MSRIDGFGIGGVVTIAVMLLLTAFLMPPAINSATSADFSDRTETVNLNVGENESLADVNENVTLESVDETNTEATFSISGENLTVGEEENSSVTVNGDQYTIYVSSLDYTEESASLSVSYTVETSGAAVALWAMIPLFMVLAVALFFVGFATKTSDGL